MMTLSIRKLALASALPMALALSAPAMADDPKPSQIYAEAQAGHVDQALSEMQQVLKDKPNSAPAHYVEAELLAKAGRLDEARTELTKAEQLKPGLPFAKAQAVTALKQQLNAGNGGKGGTLAPDRPAVAPEHHGFPWVPVIVVLGLVFLVVAFLRRRSEQQQAYYEPQPANPYGGQQAYGGAPQGGPWPGGYQGGGYQGGGYPQPGYPPQQQGGMGSGIMGSLAGGAAAGAGFAAGEAVIDRMFGDHHDRERVVERDVVQSRDDDDDRKYNQDMGGSDFGLSDNSSWDDSSSGGGNDDW